MDPDTYRAESIDRWTRAAPGWAARRDELQRAALPVSEWLVDAIAPQPGFRVLELAAGLGDTGFLAAELIAPGGRLICSDMAEPMLERARERARELGLDEQVEFRVIDAEWIDLPTASQDAVLCRWGYMLTADPAAALRETRRVLRPGGRVAMAAWAAPGENPWATAVGEELLARQLVPRPAPGEPGMFAFSPPGRIAGLLEGAGFQEPVVEAVDLTMRFDDLDHFLASTRDTNRRFADGWDAMEPAGRAALRAGVAERLAPWTAPDGAIAAPGRTLVAAADA